MKSVEPITGMSKRSQVEFSTTILASSTMLATEVVDSTTAMGPFGGADDIDPTVTPPLSLHAMMESFMATQAAHGQLLDELLTEVASLRANFAEYRSAFPPLPPFKD